MFINISGRDASGSDGGAGLGHGWAQGVCQSKPRARCGLMDVSPFTLIAQGPRCTPQRHAAPQARLCRIAVILIILASNRAGRVDDVTIPPPDWSPTTREQGPGPPPLKLIPLAPVPRRLGSPLPAKGLATATPSGAHARKLKGMRLAASGSHRGVAAPHLFGGALGSPTSACEKDGSTFGQPNAGVSAM